MSFLLLSFIFVVFDFVFSYSFLDIKNMRERLYNIA